jgi:O-antigen/teichoic acid export membrane protein
MENNSRFFKVLILSFGQTLTSVSSIIVGMVAARFLSKGDYATFRQTFLAYKFIVPLLLLGLPNALYYFLPRETKNKYSTVVTSLTLIVSLAFIFSLFLYAGGYKLLAKRFNNEDLEVTLKWMIGYPLYVMPVSILGAVLLSQNRSNELVSYNVITSTILSLFTIIAILITKSYSGPLKVQIFLPIFFLPIAIWLYRKYVPGKFVFPTFKDMGNMLKYSIPLGFASMISMIMLETNKVVVSLMCTPEEFANYVNGAIEIPLIGIVTGSISTVILVDMTRMIKEGEKEKAIELFNVSAIRSASILFPVMIFLLCTGKAFIVTLFSEKYIESVVPFYIYLFVLPIRIVIYGSALMALGFTRTILFRSVFDLIINTVLSVVMVFYFGYLGAAIATLMTLYFWTVPFNLVKIAQGFQIQIFSVLPFKKLFFLFLLCLSCSPLAFAHNYFDDGYWFLKLSISGILYFPVVIFFLIRFNFLILPDSILQRFPRKIKSLFVHK